MDEADFLSDRITILVDGKIKCYGSTFFLKKNFGRKYHLICTKDEDCNIQTITELLQKYIPDVRVGKQTEFEVFYHLMYEKVELFPTIFPLFSTSRREYGSIESQKFWDIFAHIGRNFPRYRSIENFCPPSQTLDDFLIDSISYELLKGPALLWSQWIAMFRKRSLCWRRSIISFISLNVFNA